MRYRLPSTRTDDRWSVFFRYETAVIATVRGELPRFGGSLSEMLNPSPAQEHRVAELLDA